jgi:DNA-binding transcriptional MerR regulator
MPKTQMTIGTAAKAAGVAVDTVRYYEREGLLSSAERTASGYRVFSPSDVERLRFIRKAKALGFTLADIADLLRLQDGGGPRTEVRSRARARIEDLSRKIAELTAIRDALVALEGRCHGRGTVAGCPIIRGVQAVSLADSSES